MLLSPALMYFIYLYGYLRAMYECVRKIEICRIYCVLVANTVTSKSSTSTREHQQAPGPLSWPILGNLPLLRCYDVPFQGFTDLAKKFGDVYSMTLGTTRCLVVNNLDLIREVLNKNGKYFGGRPDFIRFNVLFGGNRNNSLALCDWSQLQQKRRKLARKYCSPRNGSTLFQNMSDVGCLEVKELLYRLRTLENNGGGEIALKPLIQQACANMFCNYMCSIRFDYDDMAFQNIVRCFDEIFWEVNQGYAVDFLPWLGPFYINHMKKIAKWSETIRTFILDRIIIRREVKIDTEEPDKDFIDALLKSLSENEDVTRDSIIYMLEDFIGGHSAIGNLVMLALAYIVKNPEVSLKIQTEIDNVLAQGPRFIIQGDIEKMPYTMSTIYEVLRYCSSPIVPHVATKDVVIGGYGVSKGTIVFINNYELNTSSKYWNNPNKFDPARFLTVLESSKVDPLNKGREYGRIKKNIPHFIPFSIGKRTCIGQSLVKGFGFTLLANIVYKYNVSSNDVSKIKTYPACIAVPPETFSLTLTPRSV